MESQAGKSLSFDGSHIPTMPSPGSTGLRICSCTLRKSSPEMVPIPAEFGQSKLKNILLSNFFWMIVRYTRGNFWMYLNVCFWLAVGICQFVHGKLWGATGAALLWTITQCLLSAPNISASSRKSSLLSTWTSKRLILNFKTIDGTNFDRPCYWNLRKWPKKSCNSSIPLLCCSTLISYISYLPSETITPWQLP